jgi:hypothetical protein
MTAVDLAPEPLVVHLERAIPGVGTLIFDEAPAGSPTKKGTPRVRAKRAYTLRRDDGSEIELPSVTKIINKVSPKQALLSWYEACGAEGAVTAERAGALHYVEPADAIDVVRRLGMGAKEQMEAGQRRGVAIHAILERYLRDGVIPNPEDFPDEYQGYIRALARFLRLHPMEPEPDGVERLVCHPELGYAGRMDLRARVGAGGVSTVVDLKTNKDARIYPEAHIQTVAYAMADERSGAKPAENILIAAMGADGSFAVANGVGTPAMWRSAVSLYGQMGALDEAVRTSRPQVVEAA